MWVACERLKAPVHMVPGYSPVQMTFGAALKGPSSRSVFGLLVQPRTNHGPVHLHLDGPWLQPPIAVASCPMDTAQGWCVGMHAPGAAGNWLLWYRPSPARLITALLYFTSYSMPLMEKNIGEVEKFHGPILMEWNGLMKLESSHSLVTMQKGFLITAQQNYSGEFEKTGCTVTKGSKRFLSKGLGTVDYTIVYNSYCCCR